MIWWLIAGIFLLLMAWILLAPMRLEIDTRSGLFRVRWVGFGAAQWLPEERLDCVYVETWFFRKRLFLGDLQTRPGRVKKRQKNPRKTKRSIRLATILKIFRNLRRSFRVRQCRVDWDTGDYLWNAWLFPVTRQWSRGNVAINFSGRREIVLVVENSAGAVLMAITRSFISKT